MLIEQRVWKFFNCLTKLNIKYVGIMKNKFKKIHDCILEINNESILCHDLYICKYCHINNVVKYKSPNKNKNKSNDSPEFKKNFKQF